MKTICAPVFCPPPLPCVLPLGFPAIPGVGGGGGGPPVAATGLSGVSTTVLKLPGCVDAYILRRDRVAANNATTVDYLNTDGTPYTGPLVGLTGIDAVVNTDTRHHDFAGPVTLTVADLTANTPALCVLETSFSVRINALGNSAILTEGAAVTSLSEVGESRDGIDETGWTLEIPSGMTVVCSWEFTP